MKKELVWIGSLNYRSPVLECENATLKILLFCSNSSAQRLLPVLKAAARPGGGGLGPGCLTGSSALRPRASRARSDPAAHRRRENACGLQGPEQVPTRRRNRALNACVRPSDPVRPPLRLGRGSRMRRLRRGLYCAPTAGPPPRAAPTQSTPDASAGALGGPSARADRPRPAPRFHPAWALTLHTSLPCVGSTTLLRLTHPPAAEANLPLPHLMGLGLSCSERRGRRRGGGRLTILSLFRDE